MFSAYRAAGVPAPKLRCEHYGMWLEFDFDQAYLTVLRAGQRQTGQVPPQSDRTSDRAASGYRAEPCF